jgi:hypothetical protein
MLMTIIGQVYLQQTNCTQIGSLKCAKKINAFAEFQIMFKTMYRTEPSKSE